MDSSVRRYKENINKFCLFFIFFFNINTLSKMPNEETHNRGNGCIFHNRNVETSPSMELDEIKYTKPTSTAYFVLI